MGLNLQSSTLLSEDTGVPFDQLQAEQILLELAGATLLLLDEPTDNLDLPSAEALQQGLESYQGTVLAVTHDRWFARSFERFLLFTSDGDVREATEPVWELAGLAEFPP